ncbi:hypothetical protein LIER_06179 [Lithospermum erythrorhizon]|uniref:Uncharacterized protein n=1 Tax=Lithospermum erythrorhizon TaxID=34254 RepID=A0AAV3P3C4_LITER
MPFTARLSALPIRLGFVLVFYHNSYNTEAPRASLKDFHEQYKAILNNIPSIDNKIAYMAFYRGLNYGKLKKVLVLETPLMMDELTKMVNKYID